MPGPISQSYEGPSDDPSPFPPRWAYPHLSDAEYEEMKSRLAPDEAPCPDDQHRWVRRRMGGPPDAAESLEVVEYCDVCGVENTEAD